MTDIRKLEEQGYRFSLVGDRIQVRRYGKPIDKTTIAALDREQVIRTLRDRSDGFRTDGEQVLSVQHEDLAMICTRIRVALDDGLLWDARAVYHRKSMRTTFYFVPPGVIE